MQSYMTRRIHHSSPPQLDYSAAAAVAESLDLDFRQPCALGRETKGYFSDDAKYCLLISGCLPLEGMRYGACLLDSCGHPLWRQDITSEADPVVAHDGTVAIMTRHALLAPDHRSVASDSIACRFISRVGQDLATWLVPTDSLGLEGRWNWRRCLFLPATDNLVVLSVRVPRGLYDPSGGTWTPAIRLIALTGQQLWSRGLPSRQCDQLYISQDGSVIVAYGPNSWSNSGEKEAREHDIQAFDRSGQLLARIQGASNHEVTTLLVDSTGHYLYYDTGQVQAFDLTRGRLVSPPPEEPLQALVKTGNADDSDAATALLHKIHGDGWRIEFH
jgi:hypothetical protein